MIIASYLASKNYNEAANWYVRLISVKKNPTKTDYYNAGYTYYKANNYQSSDSVFTVYQQKYPDDIVGWYMGAVARSNIDSTSALGLAMPDYEKVIELAQKSADTVRGKQQRIIGYNYMINYYYNVRKDKDQALLFNEKILAIDPTNQQALDNEKALKQPMKQKIKEDVGKEKTKTDTSKVKVTPTKTKVK